MSARVAEIIGCIGPKGSGKSYLANAMMMGEKYHIMTDIAREFDQSRIVVYTPKDLFELMAGHDKRKPLHICWRGSETLGPQEAFEWACQAACKFDGRCAVGANETETMIPKSKEFSKSAARVIRMGRHNEVPLIWTALQLTNVHPMLRGNADSMCFFKSGDFNAKDHIRKTAGPEALEAYEALEKYHFIEYSANTGWKKRNPVKLSKKR